ncbi:MAG: hypothetical protein AAGA20_08220 [Planctomycetota bacterium]
MTRTFRLGLFVCLAAAIGLHVQPCVLSLVCDGPSEDRAVPAVRVERPSPALALVAATPRVADARRPALDALASEPEPVDALTHVVDVR